MILSQLQQSFLDALRSPDERAGVDLPLGATGIGPELGFDIYRNAYRQRLQGSLAQDYPVLRDYLGERLFLDLATAYVSTHESHHASLGAFGDRLSDFVESTDLHQHAPEASEIAAFEQRLKQAFEAADSAAVPFTDLKSLPPAAWPNLRLKFNASVALLPVRWNSVALWTALKHSEAPPARCPAASHWLVWRGADQVTRFRSLEPAERVLMEGFRQGHTFAVLCEALTDHLDPEDISAYALQCLQIWFDNGLVSAIID